MKEIENTIKEISKYFICYRNIVDKIKEFKEKYDNDGNRNVYEGFIKITDFNDIVKSFIICKDQNLVFDENDIFPSDYLFTLYGIPIYEAPITLNLDKNDIILSSNPIDKLIKKYEYSLNYKEKDIGKEDVDVPDWVYEIMKQNEYQLKMFNKISKEIANKIITSEDFDDIRDIPFSFICDGDIMMDRDGFINVPIDMSPIDPDNVEEGEDE